MSIGNVGASNSNHRLDQGGMHRLAMDPNDIIDTIVDAIDYAEIARDAQGLIKARRLLNNDLRQAIDQYIQDEINRALEKPGAGARPS